MLRTLPGKEEGAETKLIVPYIMKRETEAQKGPCPDPYILPDSRGPGQEDDSLVSCCLLSEKKEWPGQLPAAPWGMQQSQALE